MSSASGGNDMPSGGSIYITAATLAGSGVISAQGTSNTNINCFGGSGGRIAVIASTSSFAGTLQAYGGLGWVSGFHAAAGTVFIKTPGTNGSLIIDNNNKTTPGVYTDLPSADYTGIFDQVQLNREGSLKLISPTTMTITTANFLGDGTTGYLRVDGALNFPTTYTMSGWGLVLSSMTTVSVSTLTVGGSSGAIITHEYNAASEVHKASMTMTSLTIASNGIINVVGRGYTSGSGPGYCSSGQSGAYGGEGGACAGYTYGTYNAPMNLGSGGAGASGGGAVILNLSSTLTNNGSILADAGSPGGNQMPSGGSIYINASALTGTGIMSVQGGSNGNIGCYGGGGGRIAVIASTSSYSGTLLAYGGTGWKWRTKCSGRYNLYPSAWIERNAFSQKQ